MSNLSQFTTASPGPAGPVGVVGDIGGTGIDGATGLTGSQGGQGGGGIAGPVGPPGPLGGQGGIGINGPPGQAGIAGPEGPAGSSPGGPQGSPGPSGIKGVVGDTGSVGSPGSTGPPGASPTGPYGDDGPVGVGGPVGPPGPKGPAGTPPNLFIADQQISDFVFSGSDDAIAGFTFRTTGILRVLRNSLGNLSLSDQWTGTQITDIGDLYEVYVTRTSGNTLSSGESLLDTWLALTSARTFKVKQTNGITGNSTAVLDCTVRRIDLSASESGAITIFAEYENLN